MKKVFLVIAGSLALALGTLGTVLPVLPTVPFFLLAAFCYAKSSERLYSWFVRTTLYRENLADYMAGKGMTCAAKWRIMRTVSLFMAVGFVIMLLKGLYLPCGILCVVWGLHVIYFVFGVKTIAAETMMT